MRTKGSIGWQAALARIATWAHFSSRGVSANPNGDNDLDECAAFTVLNTHFDHQSRVARDYSALLVPVHTHHGNSAIVPFAMHAVCTIIYDILYIHHTETKNRVAIHVKCHIPHVPCHMPRVAFVRCVVTFTSWSKNSTRQSS